MTFIIMDFFGPLTSCWSPVNGVTGLDGISSMSDWLIPFGSGSGDKGAETQWALSRRMKKPAGGLPLTQFECQKEKQKE